jgi:hypothetical protein
LQKKQVLSVLQTNGSGVLSFSSVPTEVKAWVNFNGTGTPAIRGSLNVSSITDNGTGNYTVNFTTAISDANYASSITVGGSSANDSHPSIQDTYTTTTLQYKVIDFGGTARDGTFNCVAIFR